MAAFMGNRPNFSLTMLLMVFIILGGCSQDGAINEARQSGDNSGINPIDNNGGGSSDNPDDEVMPCQEFDFSPKFDIGTTFPPWESSPYNLPFKKGERYLVHQGNTSGFGHSGFWRYGYDFLMDIGTEVYAARLGHVVYTFEDASDGNANLTNLITIQHKDGTVALYSHLTKNGSLVEIGEEVERGQLIGLSGNTGNTGGIPHLHFSVHPCPGLPGLPDETNCPSQPVTFSNTEENPDGLGTGECYTAN